MKTRFAYLGVIIIWSTTPLAIKWSAEGVSFLMAVASRMVLGLAGACIVLLILKQVLPVNRPALKTYVTSGITMYLAMTGVYWSSQFIPSGWISVIFGLSPIITGVMAITILNQNLLTPVKLAGMILGLIGLIIIFGNGYRSGTDLFLGILVVLFCTVVHSLSAVLIKHFDARLTGFASAAGGLLVGVPLFVLTCLIASEPVPQTIPDRAFYSILYLGIIASTFGFALYYYVLTRMDVGKVSLITLITPVTALVIGNLFNNETINLSVLIGTVCITSGLLFYQFGEKVVRVLIE